MELIENRVLIEVTNESEHAFAFDGEWLRSGEWKSDKTATIAPGSLTMLELQSTHARGVSGVIWWTDSSDHSRYLSMAVANPRLQTAQFVCYAGRPPLNLKEELELAPRLVKDEQVLPENSGCAWVTAAEGNLTVVKLVIFKELDGYDRPTAATRGGATSSSAPAPAPPGANEAAAGEAAFSPPPRQPAEPCTTLAAVGGQDQNVAAAGDASNPAEDEEQAREALGKFMAQTRPKDALDGLGKGLKTAGTSLAAGAANVVASTISGYSGGGGALGVLKGLGAGLVGGAAIAVGGTACGVAQITRGIVNTPEAMRGRREHRVWDQELGQWVDIDLCALEQQVIDNDSDDEAGAEASASGDARVVDSEYYDLLRVAPHAQSSEIKKAYYREARRCHPDKCPGDVEAKAKFQKLADAYQVLSDPQLRKKYDREGKEGIQEGSHSIDPSVFFSLLFGSERFDPWVGELQLAMQTDQLTKTMESMERDAQEDASAQSVEDDVAMGEAAAGKMKRKQTRREVRCACHLRDKLDRVVYDRDYDGWEEQMRLEASDLVLGQFGPELLSTLGEMYQLRAEIFLADELVGRFSLTKRMASIKHSGVTMRHRFQFYQNAASSLLRVKKVHDAARGSGTASPSSSTRPETPSSSTRPEAQADSNGKAGTADSSTGSQQPADGQEGADEEQRHRAIEEALDGALPKFLETAWAAVVTDIDGTVKEVGRKLLKDKSVVWQIRVRRAQALQRLGQILLEEGSKAQEAQGDTASRVLTSEAAKQTLQEALMGSVREKR